MEGVLLGRLVDLSNAARKRGDEEVIKQADIDARDRKRCMEEWDR